MSKRNCCLLLFLILFICSGKNILAQQYISQDGHALDANMRVGSFGWNTPVRLDPLVPRVNLMITGNVRGGQSFQGLIPYQSIGELQTGLGTDTLSNFRRDSIGARDLSASRSFQVPTPYVDTSRQVTRSFGNTIANTYDVARQWTPPTQSSRRLSQNQYRALRPITRLNRSLNVLNPSPIANPLRYSQAIRRSVWEAPELTGKKTSSTEPTTLSGALQRKERLSSPQNYNEQVFELLEAQEKSKSSGGISTLPLQKGYRQIQDDLELRRKIQGQDLESGALAGAVDSGGTSQQETGDALSEEASDAGDYFLSQEGLAHAKVTEKIAALNQKQYQSYMTQGESLMSQGRFYRAADSFGSAIFFAPQNGPAVIAKAHALFAAGEFMSSAFYLNQAIDLSKELALAPVDMEALLGDAQVLEQRLDDLANWQERTGNAMLLFLQGYVQLKMGHSQEAKASLEKSLALEPDLVSIQVLLTRLGEQP